MTVNDTDKFLVNRSGDSFHLEAQNMAELQDTDLMLVNRGGVSFKATGADIKDSLGPQGVPNKPSIVAPADGAGMLISAESDEITNVTSNASFTALTFSGNKDLSGDPSFEVGDAVEQDSGYTPISGKITGITDKSYEVFPNGYVDDMMGLYLNQSVQKGLLLAKLLDGSDVANAPATHGMGTVTLGGPGTPWAIGDVLNVALDSSAGKVWFGINGTWLNSGNPPNGTGMLIQAPANSPMYFQATTQLPQSRGCSFGINRVAENTIPAGFTLFTGSWINGGDASAIDAPDSTGPWPGVKTYAEFKYLSAADGVSGPGGANLINLGFTNGPATGGTYSLKILELENSTDLNQFRVGDEVQTGVKILAIDPLTPSITTDGGTWVNGDVVTGPATTPATGTVGSIDASANTITLAASDESYPKRWIVNQGKFVKGPASPSKDAAPNVSGLTLFGSAFTSTPAESLGQTGASWQVAAYDDISFTSPLAQALNSTTDLNQWLVDPELSAETQYRCRVKYFSLALESEWSDASTFKTNV